MIEDQGSGVGPDLWEAIQDHQRSLSSGRLVRHEPMISSDEAQQWRHGLASVAGMGVGAGIAVQLGLVGIGSLRIADGDKVEVSNLNRHPLATAEDVGVRKDLVVYEYLRALDPMINVDVRDRIDFITAADEFVTGSVVVIEEVDDLAVKWWLRYAAKKHGICLITATDLWDRVVIDVEDYAREPDWEPFHGLITPGTPVGEALVQLYGRYCSPEFLAAVEKRRGRGGFPQFAPTAAVAAGLVTAMVRELVILQSDRYRSGRYFFDLREVQEAA